MTDPEYRFKKGRSARQRHTPGAVVTIERVGYKPIETCRPDEGFRG